MRASRGGGGRHRRWWVATDEPGYPCIARRWTGSDGRGAMTRGACPNPATRPLLPGALKASKIAARGLVTVGQAPNSLGISRRCPPVRNRQTAPSNCARSRRGYGPNLPIGRLGLDGLPLLVCQLRLCHTRRPTQPECPSKSEPVQHHRATPPTNQDQPQQG